MLPLRNLSLRQCSKKAKYTGEITMTTNHTQAQESKAPLLADYVRNQETEQQLQQNPRHVILLLLQGAIDKANLAKICQQSGAEIEKGFHLGRMTSILDALRDRLTFSAETPLATDLEDLYQYCDQCVQQAVFESDLKSLDSAIAVLTELRDGWMEMLEQIGDILPNA